MRLWAARQRGSAPGPGRLHADVRSHGHVLVVSLLYIGINNWLPTIGKTFGSLSNLEIASLTAVPWACAAVLWGRHSDRRNERCVNLAIPLVIGGAGFAAPPTMGWIKQAAMKTVRIALSLDAALLAVPATAEGLPLIEQFAEQSRSDPGVRSFTFVTWAPTTSHFQLVEVFDSITAFNNHL